MEGVRWRTGTTLTRLGKGGRVREEREWGKRRGEERWWRWWELSAWNEEGVKNGIERWRGGKKRNGNGTRDKDETYEKTEVVSTVYQKHRGRNDG